MCERDALEFEKKICKKSTDSCNVKVEKIPRNEISNFLDGLQRSGVIDKLLRRRLNAYTSALNSTEHRGWNLHISLGKLHGQFDVVVLRKSEDEGYTEFINVMYKIDSEIIPEWRNELSKRSFKNFIQMKALQRFYKEGLITRINVVPDLPV